MAYLALGLTALTGPVVAVWYGFSGSDLLTVGLQLFNGWVWGFIGWFMLLGAWTHVEKWLQKPYIFRVVITPVAIEIDQHRMLWNDMKSIGLSEEVSKGHCLVITLNNGQVVPFNLQPVATTSREPSPEIRWLVQTLQQALLQYALGSPKHIPKAIKDLIDQTKR
ncbi:MAG TPA: hypothetical protein DCG25_10300 [Acidimicrobiaceae bacterium]|nr:hypothetical protein [Acidimicrobiaceae bacterium]